MDSSNIVVAVVGVAGTLAGSGLSQWSATRNRRTDSENLRRDRADDRANASQAAARTEKLSLYSDYNASARAYRVACQDMLFDWERGHSPIDDTRVERIREDYLRLYAQAQMIMSDRALEIASEINQLLAEGYRMVRGLSSTSNPHEADFLHGWFEGPASDGVWLLRLASVFHQEHDRVV
ncbi:hypothetical protein [Catenulispora pinisilvae]|uniref:hypothetical protein n=1 Tax=Catenulispora pinisilvae TaxID=2705253 RepID=UPI001892799B|nr:hypothetical protein [Catenulispora pinisilvae]